MSQEHGHDEDRKFLRNFGAIIIALALAGLTFGIIANVYSSDYTSGKSPQFRPMTNQNVERVQPVGQVNYR